jgi:alpha-glucuronidase
MTVTMIPTGRRFRVLALPTILLTLLAIPSTAQAEDGYALWLRYAPVENAQLRAAYRQAIAGVVVQQSPATAAIVSRELALGLEKLLGAPVPAWTTVTGDGALVVGTPASPLVSALRWGTELQNLGADGFLIRQARVSGRRALVVASSSDRGALYGAFHLLRLLSTGTPVTRLEAREKPRHQLRMLNHWDNLDGSIERGYAGRSLWKWDELPVRVDPRLVDYARANASLGLNGTVLNNVNANARSLTAEYIAKAAAIADTFRPYGLKVFLSANFAAPRTIGGLQTADPLDPAVQKWWSDKATEIYKAIPDFGGFLVKANSEGQPGPQDYKRTHADGANMLADAVKPHGGIVMWRAFVYDASVDPDRINRAYKEFVPLDGKFRDNVFVQTKNGPLDFMPREPYHPVFGAMPKTPNTVELQITQEYLGHSNHLVYLAPMWKEFFDSETFVKGPGSTVAKVADGTLQGHAHTAIAGVANTGSDRNWTGHHFAAANWYAFGRLAWNSSLTSEAIAAEWIQQTWSRRPETRKAIATLMLGSREAFVNYTMPLGLHHLIGGDHYAVMPENDDKRRLDWSAIYYHRADEKGIGFDRTRSGSGAVDQYQKQNADRWNDPKTTPENLLLWFHHLPWTYRLKSGQTLWQGLVAYYDKGAEQAAQMENAWAALKGSVDDERHAAVAAKLRRQTADAAAWRDKCLAYFAQFSKLPTKP